MPSQPTCTNKQRLYHLSFIFINRETISRGGFISFDVGKEDMILNMHRENGDVLHMNKLKPRNINKSESKRQTSEGLGAESQPIVAIE